MTERPALHVVVIFRESETEHGIVASEPVAYQTRDQARRAAQIAATSAAGVIAWSRTADPEAGEYGEPDVILRKGTIPDWFDESGGIG